MLDFINNNSALFAGMVGIFTALLSSLVTLIVSRNTDKSKTISELKEELKEARSELKEARNSFIECKEELQKYMDLEETCGYIFHFSDSDEAYKTIIDTLSSNLSNGEQSI